MQDQIMHKPLVKINTATPKEITKLNGIGRELAVRIVKHREEEAFFSRPKDLARVKGISLQLALTVAPQIDWQVPIEPRQLEKEKIDYFWLFLVTALNLCLVGILLPKVLSRLLASVEAYSQLKVPVIWVSIWINASVVTAFAFLSIGGFFFIGAYLYLCGGRPAGKKLLRIGWILIGVFIVAMISCGLGNAIYYQFYSPHGWLELSKNPVALSGLVSSFVLVTATGPVVLFLLRPAWASKRLMSRLFDLALVSVSPIIAGFIWIYRGEMPLWFLGLSGLVGFLLGRMGLNVIRTGESFFLDQLIFLVPNSRAHRALEKSVWLAWINALLPNPEQQKALKEALNEAYPSSPVRTLFGMIVFGAGAWLVITTLNSIVGWLVQKGLNYFWP